MRLTRARYHKDHGRSVTSRCSEIVAKLDVAREDVMRDGLQVREGSLTDRKCVELVCRTQRSTYDVRMDPCWRGREEASIRLRG